ncbi:hypothetical protein LX66_5059 [Chitinophaga japonensis]|uniref:Uncharacterized protein n=1 Tax=Chitinophaga japonensis TaxID=104662 RepID=A0A562SP70_CHIJA|nr:hypothetical protein LX66_5059 [Chitinophaga japonensis]
MIGVLAQTFSKAMIVAEYQLNRDYIAKFLCVNRDKPKLHCNGRCHMMKKIKQEEKKDQDNPERKAENKFEIITAAFQPASITPFRTVSNMEYPVFQESICTDFTASFFHPPQV